jgi:cytidine deaminase
LSDSESGKSWPPTDRRESRDRRTVSDRRTTSANGVQAGDPAGAERRVEDRRTGGERRNEAAWQAVPLDATGSSAGSSAADSQWLLAAAADARTRAHARFSSFKVGAALETADGRIVTGCNIENATYGLTLCAERVALAKALSDGHAEFTRIAVVADTIDPTPPCGSCRQLLWEFCGDIDVILGNLEGATGRYRLSALLPLPFDARFLRG